MTVTITEKRIALALSGWYTCPTDDDENDELSKRMHCYVNALCVDDTDDPIYCWLVYAFGVGNIFVSMVPKVEPHSSYAIIGSLYEPKRRCYLIPDWLRDIIHRNRKVIMKRWVGRVDLRMERRFT